MQNWKIKSLNVKAVKFITYTVNQCNKLKELIFKVLVPENNSIYKNKGKSRWADIQVSYLTPTATPRQKIGCVNSAKASGMLVNI